MGEGVGTLCSEWLSGIMKQSLQPMKKEESVRSSLAADQTQRAGSFSVVAGFACNQAFIFSLFYLGANRAFGEGPFAFERADLFGTLLCMVVAFVLLQVASVRARDALLAQPLVWCYACLLVVGSLASVLIDAGGRGIVVESVLVGVPSGFMLAAWGRALGSRSVQHSVRAVFIASAAAAVLCLVMALIPTSVALILLKFAPLGSAYALNRLAASASNHAESLTVKANAATSSSRGALSFGDLFATKEQREETVRLSRKIVAGTALFGLAAGFMETFASEPGMASTPAFLASLLLLALFCVAALQFLAAGVFAETSEAEAGAEGPLDNVYRLSALVMLTGFLFVPVLGSFGVPGESIVLAGYLGLTCVLISLFLVMSKITGQDAALAFARGFTFLYVGEMAGIMLGNGIELLEPAGQVPYAVASCAGLIVLFAYLFLFTERDFRSLSIIVHTVDRFDEACAYIVETCGLSKREAEILPLALKGRTGERIAAEFFISKSTVDTHLRRIYAKTGTHNRQELIDLGERTVRDLSHTLSK